MSDEGRPAASCPSTGVRQLRQVRRQEHGLWSHTVRGPALLCDPDRGPPLGGLGASVNGVQCRAVSLFIKGRLLSPPLPAPAGLLVRPQGNLQPPEADGLAVALSAVVFRAFPGLRPLDPQKSLPSWEGRTPPSLRPTEPTLLGSTAPAGRFSSGPPFPSESPGLRSPFLAPSFVS